MTSTTDRPQLLDTSVMPTLHTFFRRELRLAPGVVRSTADGDRRRARVVAHHLDFVLRSLHHHHTIEDELLWPKLLVRVAEDTTSLVHLVESQHAVVDALLTEVTALLPRFTARADAHDRDRMAALLSELHVRLIEHLDLEEARILPLAAQHLTQAEWDEMGEAGRSGTPRRELALTLGMYQCDGDPDVIAAMLAEAPPPVRVVVPLLSRRAFRKHARRVHGTADPAALAART
jgi:hemerythrin-like domain-containing protein